MMYHLILTHLNLHQQIYYTIVAHQQYLTYSLQFYFTFLSNLTHCIQRVSGCYELCMSRGVICHLVYLVNMNELFIFLLLTFKIVSHLSVAICGALWRNKCI